MKKIIVFIINVDNPQSSVNHRKKIPKEAENWNKNLAK